MRRDPENRGAALAGARAPRGERQDGLQLAIEDVDGHDSEPDPLETRTEEEFVDPMRRYRAWTRAGDGARPVHGRGDR